LPNRVLMITIKLDYGTPQGEVTKRHIAFYVRRAEGREASLSLWASDLWLRLGTHPLLTASPIAYRVANAAEIALGWIP
jgi:hypothetical protein